MDGNQFEQFIAQMVSGLQQSTDWMIRNQRAEIDVHDQRLAAAEQVLRSALDFIAAERQRLRPQPKENLRQIHDKLVGQAQAPQTGRIAEAKNKQPF